MVSILTSTLTAAPTNTARNDLYYYFYNWSISTGCESARVPVVATVTAAPPISTSGNVTVCEGTPTTLSIVNGLADYTDFTWSPSTGLSSTTGSSVTATPSATTKYYVLASGNVNIRGAVKAVIVNVVVLVVPNII